MAATQKAIIDHINQSLLINTTIDFSAPDDDPCISYRPSVLY